MAKLSAYTKSPGGPLRHVNISATLENLQQYVGGYIETVTFFSKEGRFIVICDEEGRLKGYEPNCTIYGTDFVGDIVILGQNEDEFDDVPVSFQFMKSIVK